MWHICTMEYYSAVIKNEAVPSAATWMDLEINTLSEVRSDRERQISYDITYMWNLKEKMIQMRSSKKTDTESQTSKTNYSYQRGHVGGGMNQEFEINLHTLLQTK